MGKVYITDNLVGEKVEIEFQSGEKQIGMLVDISGKFIKMRTPRVILYKVRDVKSIGVLV